MRTPQVGANDCVRCASSARSSILVDPIRQRKSRARATNCAVAPATSQPTEARRDVVILHGRFETAPIRSIVVADIRSIETRGRPRQETSRDQTDRRREQYSDREIDLGNASAGAARSCNLYRRVALLLELSAGVIDFDLVARVSQGRARQQRRLRTVQEGAQSDSRVPAPFEVLDSKVVYTRTE